MTSDSKHFTRRKALEERGLLSAGDDTRDPRVRVRLRLAGHLPLYEGKCISLHNPYYAQPENFIEIGKLPIKVESAIWARPRVCTRNIGRSTDQRTLITGLLPSAAHGNSTPSLDGLDEVNCITIKGVLSSLTIDYVTRMKVSANLNWFYLETLPIASVEGSRYAEVAGGLVRMLNCLGADFPDPIAEPLENPRERFAARLLLDALVADLYELHPDDLAHIATRFPIYDRKAPDEYRFQNAAVEVYRAMHSEGLEAAERAAQGLAARRSEVGCGFGLDEVYVPEGGWARANAEARAILS